MKKVKSINNSQQLPVVTKEQGSKYVDFCDYKQLPVSESNLKELAKRLELWAITDDDALKFKQFLVRERVCWDSFYRWMEKSPELKRAHALALDAIGNRREVGAIKRSYDSGMVRSSMPIYDKDWTTMEEWRGKITQEQNKDNEQKVVIIERFPETLEVKSRRSPEEVANDAVARTKNGHR